MQQLSVVRLISHRRDFVGKRVPTSKLRESWVIRSNGGTAEIVCLASYFTMKRRIEVDGKLVYSGYSMLKTAVRFERLGLTLAVGEEGCLAFTLFEQRRPLTVVTRLPDPPPEVLFDELTFRKQHNSTCA
jgi:hypothetical protein